MEKLASLFHQHLATMQQHAQNVLTQHHLDAVLIHSGEPLMRFLDDQEYPFKVNPQFKAWVPVTHVPHCWLWVDGVNKPRLWFYSPVDYWHNVAPLPESFWTKDIDVIVLRNADEIGALLPAARDRVAYLGYVPERALSLGIVPQHINPKPILDYLHYHRAYKTDYELFCMREAQKTAVVGHRAAQSDHLFAQLIKDLNQGQQALIESMRVGVRYTDYHIQMHQRVAKLLHRHHLVQGMSEEAMLESGLTWVFLPHGLGHPLGLQVHDVGGFMQDERGTHLAAPEAHPYLRCTRVMQPRMVLTIESGIYFIESLLAPWHSGQYSQHIDWKK